MKCLNILLRKKGLSSILEKKIENKDIDSIEYIKNILLTMR